jgi:hypothetical protein
VEEAVKAEVTDAAQPTSSANVPAQKLEVQASSPIRTNDKQHSNNISTCCRRKR